MNLKKIAAAFVPLLIIVAGGAVMKISTVDTIAGTANPDKSTINIPLIDKGVPASFETATFALG